jgi:putative ABC transport system permease protein
MWWRCRRTDEDFKEEIDAHLAQDTDRRVAEGLSPREARAAAHRAFGNVTWAHEHFYESRRLMWLDDLERDTRYTLRGLIKAKVFTVVAILMLALGIGANTAIFTLLYTILLRPLPFREPDSLVMVWEDQTRYGFPQGTPAPANYVDWRAQNHVFEDMAAMVWRDFTITGNDSPERVAGVRLTANLLPMLGVQPMHGRVFHAADDTPEAPPTVLLSYGLWQRRFGGDRSLLGQTITLNGAKSTVVGIMPAGFQFPSREADLWVPAAFTSRELAERDSHYLMVVARLKDRTPLRAAEADMAVIARALEQQYPISNKDLLGVRVVPLREHYAGTMRVSLVLLLATVGTVLLIACANVAHLLLARATARRREMGLRMALGAGRGRIVRQLLTECLVLAGVGELVGLVFARMSFLVLGQLIPQTFPHGTNLTLNLPILLFTTAVAFATAMVCGAFPTLQTARMSLTSRLKESSQGGPHGKGRLRDMLVVLEMTLTVLLLVAAGLLLQSYARLRSLHPGFRSGGVLTAETVLSPARYGDFPRRAAFVHDVLERVQGLPGVLSSGYANYLPLTYKGGTVVFSIEGRPVPAPGQQPVQTAYNRNVSADYFRAMGIPLQRGRSFDERDRPDSLPVVIISGAMARSFWSKEDPVGARIAFGYGPVQPGQPSFTIVGVVGDVKEKGLEVPIGSELYFPLTQVSQSGTFGWPRHLVIRATGDPLKLASDVRRAIWSIDPDQPVEKLRTMDDIVDSDVSNRHLQMVLLITLSMIALVLASAGLYGVLSFRVAQRVPEIGLRIALGANRREVVGSIVGKALFLVGLGVAVGLVGAMTLTRVLSSLLFGVSPTDPMTFGVVALILTAVAAAASYVPARRAARVNPLIALKYE